MGSQGVVGGILVPDDVCLGIDRSLSPGTARLEEEKWIAFDVAPASDKVGEVAYAELELLLGRDTELEQVSAEEAGRGIVDVGQHVGKRAPAFLCGLEVCIENMFASIGRDEAELFACRTGLSHCSSLSWL